MNSGCRPPSSRSLPASVMMPPIAGAVPAEPLGEGIHHDVCAVLDGPQQVGGGEGGVHDEGQAVAVGHSAIGPMSTTSSSGLPMVSMKMARVLGVMALWKVLGRRTPRTRGDAELRRMASNIV